LGRTSDSITLGSLFPDMAINARMTHTMAHSMGKKILQICKDNSKLLDFARGVVTHGISPRGLDYYGDEKFPGCERGYCFEKGRSLVEQTIDACNIPAEMGWWKAHNIVEMGIELRVSNRGPFGQTIRRAFNNHRLINQIGNLLADITGYDRYQLKSRIAGFPDYIEIFQATPQSLANKYRIQMFARHRININTAKVARLIEAAAEQVEDDLAEFFRVTNDNVLAALKDIEKALT